MQTRRNFVRNLAGLFIPMAIPFKVIADVCKTREAWELRPLLLPTFWMRVRDWEKDSMDFYWNAYHKGKWFGGRTTISDLLLAQHPDTAKRIIQEVSDETANGFLRKEMHEQRRVALDFPKLSILPL